MGLGLGVGLSVGNGSGLKFVGSGPLASAPVASANDGKYFYDNVTSVIYRSVDGEWVGVNAWLIVGDEYVTLNGENINVDDPNLIIIVGETGFIDIDENNSILVDEV